MIAKSKYCFSGSWGCKAEARGLSLGRSRLPERCTASRFWPSDSVHNPELACAWMPVESCGLRVAQLENAELFPHTTAQAADEQFRFAQTTRTLEPHDAGSVRCADPFSDRARPHQGRSERGSWWAVRNVS